MSLFLNISSGKVLRVLEENRVLSKIFTSIGNIFSLIFFATPLIQIISKKLYSENEIKKMPLFLILAIIFNCLFWLLNAFCSDDLTEWIPLLISNIGGLLMNTILLFFYLYMFLEKDKKKFLGFGFFVVNLIAEITYLIYRYVIKEKTDSDSTFHLIGFVATIINVIMYSSPWQNIKETIKEEKYETIPIYTLLSGLLSTFIFFVHGLISYCYANDLERNAQRNAIETMVSNGISIIILGCLLGIYIFYYFKPRPNLRNQIEEEFKNE